MPQFNANFPGGWLSYESTTPVLYPDAQKVVAPTPADSGSVASSTTTTSIINTVSIAIAPVPPTAAAIASAAAANEPAPVATIPYVTIQSPDSVAQFGEQATPIVVTLLETLDDADLLGRALMRPIPPFWFTEFEIDIGSLSAPNKAIVAQLEIGNQLSATISFPAGVTPSSVTQRLFVEGIAHRISPKTGHKVTIYAGPAPIFDLFQLDSLTLGLLDDLTIGIG